MSARKASFCGCSGAGGWQSQSSEASARNETYLGKRRKKAAGAKKLEDECAQSSAGAARPGATQPADFRANHVRPLHRFHSRRRGGGPCRPPLFAILPGQRPLSVKPKRRRPSLRPPPRIKKSSQSKSITPLQIPAPLVSLSGRPSSSPIDGEIVMDGACSRGALLRSAATYSQPRRCRRPNAASDPTAVK